MNLADSSGACGYSRFDALRRLIAKELPDSEGVAPDQYVAVAYSS
jgi:hypothetical protein